MKTCCRCKETKPLSEFSLQKNLPDGFQRRCKSCDKAYRKENADRRKAYGAVYGKAYWANNKEKASAATKAWYCANKQRRNEKSKAWETSNKDRRRAIGARRRSAKLNAMPSWASDYDTAAWYEVADVLSRSGVKYEVDHIVPLQGETVCGLHTEANLQVLPRHKNRAKKNVHWPDMP